MTERESGPGEFAWLRSLPVGAILTDKHGDAWPVRHHLDAVFLQMRRRPDAGKHEQLGRIDGGSGENHFPPRLHDLNLPPPLDLHADRALILDDYTSREAAD